MIVGLCWNIGQLRGINYFCIRADVLLIEVW